MAKIKDRTRRRAALNDRKSAAAQARMKNIASLAADDRVPKAKKRKGGGGPSFRIFFSNQNHSQLSWKWICSAPMMLTGIFISKLIQLLPLLMRKTTWPNFKPSNKSY